MDDIASSFKRRVDNYFLAHHLFAFRRVFYEVAVSEVQRTQSQSAVDVKAKCFLGVDRRSDLHIEVTS